MRYIFSLVLGFTVFAGLTAQPTTFSWITDVQKTDDGGVVIEVSFYDEVGVEFKDQEAPLAKTYVFAKTRLPRDAEISVRRFSTYSPYVVEIGDKHIYFVGVYYDNKTADPKDDLQLGSASFVIDKQKSELMISALLMKYEGVSVAVHRLIEAPMGEPAFETDTVEVTDEE